MKTFEKTTTLSGVLDYRNLTDPRTMEFGVSKELTDIVDELKNLAKAIEKYDIQLVGKMKRNAIDWETVAADLEDIKRDIKNRTDFILEKFD
jgi:hypothetical protein